jgi:hypothetical protein
MDRYVLLPPLPGRIGRLSPSRWVATIKQAIATTLPRFCARRAVKAFADAAYTAVGVRS